MKKIYIFLYALFLISINSGNVKAQLENLTFDVRATNFKYYDSVTFTDPAISGLKNVMEFDIYIQQTNIPANDQEKMRFALGQYYLNYNFGGLAAADTAGVYASFSYIQGSSTFSYLLAIPTGAKCVAIAPTTDQGTYWPFYPSGILGGYLNLNSNSALGNMSDVQISQIYPGTRVGKFRLKKNITAASPSPYLPNVDSFIRWRKAPAINFTSPNPVSKIFCYNGLGGISTDVTNKGTYYIGDTLVNPVPEVNLNLKVLVEGLYYPIFNQMARKPAIKVILRSEISPYAIVDSLTEYVDSISFTAAYRFFVPYGTYYIVVKHLNSIEEWSKSGGVNFPGNGVVNYNFTSGISQGYGNNLKLKGSAYCLYSGDINQDGIIDASDKSLVSNDVAVAVTGYTVTDLNGDKIVDATDLSTTENNTGITSISPVSGYNAKGLITDKSDNPLDKLVSP